MRSIYSIRCNATGRVYVSNSYNPEYALKVHKEQLTLGTSSNPEMQEDWITFGGDTFEFSVIAEEGTEQQELLIVSMYQKLGLSYNVNSNTKQRVARKMSPEKTALMVQRGIETKRAKGNLKPTEETRNKIRQALTGMKHSAETRAKIADAARGKIRGPHSQETRNKISESLKLRNSKTKQH